MVKKDLAAIGSVAVLVLLAGDVPAQKIAIDVDGCTVLARTVYEEVSAAALYGPGRSGPWRINPQQGIVSVCRTTARTVSRAFAAAMNTAGFKVYWGETPESGGPACLSAYLSQCYPNSANKTLVRKSWAVVSQSVMRAMPNPFSSNEVRFREDDLRLRLGLSLRAIGDIPDLMY